MQYSEEAPVSFALTEEGNVRIADAAEEEMDFAAEQLARRILLDE